MKLPDKNNFNKYIQLTGVAFQMGITIYLGVFVGKKIDASLGNNNKLFTIIGTLLALVLSIYSLINQLKRINDKYD
ncbi:MAG: AtpZ/AtpI family protein [Bacteroidetes bacterium]|jgi:membrane protein DedA with SNARE-associated domain|nr:AtpZ/AtpI family protein [Bacteroidota bacterium]